MNSANKFLYHVNKLSNSRAYSDLKSKCKTLSEIYKTKPEQFGSPTPKNSIDPGAFANELINYALPKCAPPKLIPPDPCPFSISTPINSSEKKNENFHEKFFLATNLPKPPSPPVILCPCPPPPKLPPDCPRVSKIATNSLQDSKPDFPSPRPNYRSSKFWKR